MNTLTTWYRVWIGEIREVQVIKETDKCLYVLRGNGGSVMERKAGNYQHFFQDS